MNDPSNLELKFLGALVEQLGAQMYPSATATIAELISNAWDADAENVWIQMPFGESWTQHSRIVVLDDGDGMTRDEAAKAYLMVGRKRRVVLGTDKSQTGRHLHGRKGIGKLAAFGTARILECYTVSRTDDLGTPTSFRLDYDAIRQLEPGSNYDTEAASETGPLQSPDGVDLAHGTRITLSQLKLKRAISEDPFRRSMSRRFALATQRMRISSNGRAIERFDYPVQFRFPRDCPDDLDCQVEDGWAVEELDGGRQVRWWIGFTEKPLEDESLRGISVLARGKMVQRPFLFQRAQGVHGQLGLEYMVGEVRADWLDEGFDIDEDRIQANRDQLQLEDQDLEAFLNWGQQRIRWALRLRQTLREKENRIEVELSPEITELLTPLTSVERKALMRIPATLSKTEMSSGDIIQVMRDVVNAREDQVIRQMWQDIDREAEDVQAQIWDVVHRFGLIDARRNQTLIEQRLRAIDELRRHIDQGAKEVPTIHNHIRDHTWLLDPRWNLLGDEVPVENLGIDYTPGYDPETRGRLDYLFALQPSTPSGVDEILVVEIKRARVAGKVRTVSAPEVLKFHGYMRSAIAKYRLEDTPPAVTGLMIADGYTRDAEDVVRTTKIEGVRLDYRTWYRVLMETERLHRSWLTVATRRAEEDSTPPDEGPR